MGKLDPNGFLVTRRKSVLVPPSMCHHVLWDAVEGVTDGTTVQALMDILSSDVDFYGKLFGAPHLAEYLAEAPEDSIEIRLVEFRWAMARYAGRPSFSPEGDIDFSPDAVGIGHDPAQQGKEVGYVLDFTALTTLAKLPIRVNDLLEMEDNDGDSPRRVNSVLGRMPMKLIDVLAALMEEMSFNGSPAERSERITDMKNACEEAERDIASGKMKGYETLDLKDSLAKFRAKHGDGAKE